MWLLQPVSETTFARGLDHAHINNTLSWVGSRFTRDTRFLDGRQKINGWELFSRSKLSGLPKVKETRRHEKQSPCVCLETGQRSACTSQAVGRSFLPKDNAVFLFDNAF